LPYKLSQSTILIFSLASTFRLRPNSKQKWQTHLQLNLLKTLVRKAQQQSLQLQRRAQVEAVEEAVLPLRPQQEAHRAHLVAHRAHQVAHRALHQLCSQHQQPLRILL